MFEIFKSGGPVMYPLLACSIIVLTVIIERMLFWIRIDMNRSESMVIDVLDLCRKGDWEAVRLKTTRSKDYVIRILVTGILHREFSMTKAMESLAADEIRRMQQFMSIIDTMITVSPLLGILGTVTGVINSFDAIGSSGIEHPQMITAGLAEALITTAAGLIIAIFSVFPYNYFNSRIESATLNIERYATSLEIVYEKLMMADSVLSNQRARNESSRYPEKKGQNRGDSPDGCRFPGSGLFHLFHAVDVCSPEPSGDPAGLGNGRNRSEANAVGNGPQ